ncbi:MAG: helix-turn-helix transcriptional regulator [Ruminococcaceae bacterium]|nr:helix-turn-helix transcriptional regulator [Oscillospiraceae bacterium]
MKDVKATVADNLVQLRKAYGLTQAQLAEKFNYSDKAICRWEHGDTLPDINTLCALADFYGITMNDLVSPDFEASETDKEVRTVFKYRLLISAMLLAAVWLLTVVVFITTIAMARPYWIIFVWAVPASCLALMRFWRGGLMHAAVKIIIYSLFVWSLITSAFLHLLIINGVNAWMLFLIGIPLEAIIIFWQQIKKYRDRI